MLPLLSERHQFEFSHPLPLLYIQLFALLPPIALGSRPRCSPCPKHHPAFSSTSPDAKRRKSLHVLHQPQTASTFSTFTNHLSSPFPLDPCRHPRTHGFAVHLVSLFRAWFVRKSMRLPVPKPLNSLTQLFLCVFLRMPFHPLPDQRRGCLNRHRTARRHSGAQCPGFESSRTRIRPSSVSIISIGMCGCQLTGV